MAINLNDEKYAVKEGKAIFNKGVAGFAKGTATVTKRGKDDNQAGPDYKVVVTDDAGGIVEYPIFIKEELASDKAEKFYVNALKHLANSVFKVKQPGESFENYTALTNAFMGAFKNSKAKVVVFADYGKKDNPKSFLQISSAFSIKNVTETNGEDFDVYQQDIYNLTRVTPDKDKPSAYSAPKASTGSEDDSNGWD